MVAVAIIAAVASTVVGVLGTQSSARAQQSAANYNAAIAKNAAQTSSQQGMFDAQQIRDQNRRMLATQRANAAANGVDPDSGSQIDVQHSSAQQGEMQAMIALYTGASGYNAGRSRAGLYTAEGQNTITAGQYSALGYGISGATQITGIVTNPNFRH